MRLILFLSLLIYTTYSCGGEVELPDSNISFTAPDEFKPFTQKIIEAKWPARRAPEWVIGSESTSTSIAYGLKPNDISNAPLGQLMEYMKKTMSRVGPGIQWLKTEVIQINGKDWVYLELTSNAINADIHNIILVTSYEKQMVMFNFNSTKEEFPAYEDSLRASMRSISFED
jgi:hypothetical protein